MLPRDLLTSLADGRAQPRAVLAAALGSDRAGLDRELARLAAIGLELLDGDDGIRLAQPVRWLDAAAIRAAIAPAARAAVADIRCEFEIESTNRLLRERGPAPAGRLQVAVAEYQSGGRGRRGRRWTMPPGAGLALSASWGFPRAPAVLGALSLAVGAAARRALRDHAGIEVGLKWPNDLIAAGGKLGGILVEVDALADGTCHVVAGIGINVAAPAAYLARVSDFGHGASDLRTAAPGRALDRSALAGALVTRLVELFAAYAATGFEPYRDEWLAAHVLAGEPVELATPAGVEQATVRGIDADGALIVADAAGAERRIVAGDVSVRRSG